MPDATPLQMATWLICAASLVGFAYYGVSLWKMLFGKFAEREIPPREYVPLPGCRDKHKQVDEAIERIRAEAHGRIETIFTEIKTQRLETKTDIGEVHSRINDVLAAVSRLAGKLDASHGRKSYDN